MSEKDTIIVALRALGLSSTEAKIYLELLRQPSTHSQLSTATGVNRTTLYRIISKLSKHGIITERIDDVGRFLVATPPSSLEVEVLNQEDVAKRQRLAFAKVLPSLENIQKGYSADFAVHTYEGVEGFKRMLWHELKAAGEVVIIGGAPVEDLGISRRWAEKYRQFSGEAGYRSREIANPGVTPLNFTSNEKYLSHYELRIIPREVLPINHLTIIYNTTVSIYNVYEGRRMGLEIVSKTYVESVKSIFENFWSQATPIDITDVPRKSRK